MRSDNHLAGHHTEYIEGTSSGSDFTAEPSVGFQYPDDEAKPEPELGQTECLFVASNFLGAIANWIGESKTATSAGVRGFALSWLLRRYMFSETTQAQFCKNRNITPENLNRSLSQLRRIAHGLFRTKDRLRRKIKGC